MNKYTGIGESAIAALKLGNVKLEFMRTCRVPAAEGLINSLPAGLGRFAIYSVANYADRVPEDWKPEGHFICMYPYEAMWINFNVAPGEVVALLIAAGMINAVTGERLEPVLRTDPQNYIVAPPQKWIDGFKREAGGQVRQFVAAQAGKGETVEEQLTGTFEFGGIQIGVFNPKIKLIPETNLMESIIGGLKQKPKCKPPYYPFPEESSDEDERPVLRSMSFSAKAVTKGIKLGSPMGLGGGGTIRQKIYPDNYIKGLSVEEVWHEKPSDKAYVYIIDPIGFKAITGLNAPESPITFETYQKNGLPWYMLPDGTWDDTEGSKILEGIKPIGENDTPLAAKDKINSITQNIW